MPQHNQIGNALFLGIKGWLSSHGSAQLAGLAASHNRKRREASRWRSARHSPNSRMARSAQQQQHGAKEGQVLASSLVGTRDAFRHLNVIWPQAGGRLPISPSARLECVSPFGLRQKRPRKHLKRLNKKLTRLVPMPLRQRRELISWLHKYGLIWRPVGQSIMMDSSRSSAPSSQPALGLTSSIKPRADSPRLVLIMFDTNRCARDTVNLRAGCACWAGLASHPSGPQTCTKVVTYWIV